MFGSMCAALANVLNDECRSISKGWTTKAFVVCHNEETDGEWLAEFKSLVGGIEM